MCKSFEPHISVKVKEELSHGLMSVFHAEDIAEDVLAEIVVDEISSVENEHLTFRGGEESVLKRVKSLGNSASALFIDQLRTQINLNVT